MTNSDSDSSLSIDRQTNLYVKGFNDEFDDSKLSDLFSQFGSITSSKIARDKFGRSKGFGFVNYSRSSNAKKALEKLNHHTLDDGSKLCVCFFQYKDERQEFIEQENRNLYIGNLDSRVDDRQLLQLFNEFGTIESARVMVDEQGISKNYGFVCFINSKDAFNAKIAMHGKKIGSKHVFIAFNKNQRGRSLSATRESRPPTTFTSAKTRQSSSVVRQPTATSTDSSLKMPPRPSVVRRHKKKTSHWMDDV